MKVPGPIAFNIESWAGDIHTEERSHKDLHLGPSSNPPSYRHAGTQLPFFGFALIFLTDRRDFCHNAHEENEQTARMRRDGTTFVPRVRGSSESISRVGGAQG
jgi:hypothetical protein